MEKISITVKIPALDSTYDFIVPNNMSVKNAQNLMIRILNSEYGISDTVCCFKILLGGNKELGTRIEVQELVCPL